MSVVFTLSAQLTRFLTIGHKTRALYRTRGNGSTLNVLKELRLLSCSDLLSRVVSQHERTQFGLLFKKTRNTLM